MDFPFSVKLKDIIPIFKNGSKAEFSIYIPNSLLHQFSEILQKLYNKRLQELIGENSILSHNQYRLVSIINVYLTCTTRFNRRN